MKLIDFPSRDEAIIKAIKDYNPVYEYFSKEPRGKTSSYNLPDPANNTDHTLLKINYKDYNNTKYLESHGLQTFVINTEYVAPSPEQQEKIDMIRTTYAMYGDDQMEGADGNLSTGYYITSIFNMRSNGYVEMPKALHDERFTRHDTPDEDEYIDDTELIFYHTNGVSEPIDFYMGCTYKDTHGERVTAGFDTAHYNDNASTQCTSFSSKEIDKTLLQIVRLLGVQS